MMTQCTKDIILDFRTYSGEPQDIRLFQSQPRGLADASPLMPRTLRDAIVFRFVENNCGGNVFHNKASFQECSGVNDLKVTVGGYGLCRGSPGIWFEWGGYGLKAEDLLVCPYTGKKNCHFWLEDDYGNVYDYYPSYIRDVVTKVHKKTVDTSEFVCDALILGMSKEALERAGLVYVPAPKDEQKKVVRHTLQRMKYTVIG